MRKARVKPRGATHHCCNRVSGDGSERLFGWREKEQFIKLTEEMCELFAVDLISIMVMDNHYQSIPSPTRHAPAW